MSTPSDICPVCNNLIDKITKRCSKCQLSIVDFNLSRVSAKIELNGNGMSMQAGITVALSFGIFSIIQILWDKELTFWGYLLYFVVLVAFEALGYYTLFRFLCYRRAQTRNETLLNRIDLLMIADLGKQDKELDRLEEPRPNTRDPSRNQFPIKYFYIILSEKKIKILGKEIITRVGAIYLSFILALDLIILLTTPNSILHIYNILL